MYCYCGKVTVWYNGANMFSPFVIKVSHESQLPLSVTCLDVAGLSGNITMLLRNSFPIVVVKFDAANHRFSSNYFSQNQMCFGNNSSGVWFAPYLPGRTITIVWSEFVVLYPSASGYVFRFTFRFLSDVSYSDECRTKKSFSVC